MKKRIAAAAVAFLLVCALPALAYSPLGYTFEEKLTQHLTRSGYEAEGTISVAGDEMPGPAKRLFKALKALDGNRFTLNGSGEKGEMKNRFSLVFGKDGEQDFSFTFFKNGQEFLFYRDKPSEMSFSLKSGEALSLLLRAMGMREEMLLPFYVKDTADQGIAQTLAPWTEELGIWLSDYCTISADASGSVLLYRVNTRELTEKAARLLEQLLQDKDAYSHLEQWMLGSTAFSDVMEKGSLLWLPQALKRMDADGEVTVERRFGPDAAMLSTSVSVSTDPRTGTERFELLWLPEEKGESMSVTVTDTAGEQSSLLIRPAGENAFQGEVRQYVPDENGKMEYWAFSYEFSMQYGRLSDDPVAQKASQDLELCFDLTPLEESEVHPLHMEAVLHMSSGRIKKDRLYMDANVSLEDQENGSRVDIAFSGNSKPAEAFEDLSFTGAVPLLSLDTQELRALPEAFFAR